jgi:S-(hydroxymethyl)glutathione dehydrogenase/alcohol dehydrogenase
MALRGTRPDGNPYFCMTGLGTFADVMTVNESSVVKVETDLPDAQLALIGCGVTTGVGAALNTAKVRPGASVAILGCGGVGQAVIQGARIAGAAVFARRRPGSGGQPDHPVSVSGCRCGQEPQ